VPPGASGSSSISANDCVPSGTPVQLSSGDMSAPSQLYITGIVPSSSNAVEVITISSGSGGVVGSVVGGVVGGAVVVAGGVVVVAGGVVVGGVVVVGSGSVVAAVVGSDVVAVVVGSVVVVVVVVVVSPPPQAVNTRIEVKTNTRKTYRSLLILPPILLAVRIPP